jgi:hypothetical protein
MQILQANAKAEALAKTSYCLGRCHVEGGGGGHVRYRPPGVHVQLGVVRESVC